MKRVVPTQQKPQTQAPQPAYEYAKLRQLIAELKTQDKSVFVNEKLKQEPQNETYLLCRGSINMDRATDSALQDLNTVLRINPRNDLALSLRARGYALKGMWDLSMADTNAALAINPENDIAYCNRGMLYCLKNRPNEALADLDKSLALRPSGNATHWRGKTYYQLGHWDKALVDLEKMVQYASTASIFAYLGATYHQLYLHKKQDSTLRDKALEALNKAIKLNPRNEMALINRAKIHSEQKNFASAEQDLMLVIDFIHRSDVAYLERGLLYKRWGYVQRAITDFTACIALNPQNAAAFIHRGRMHMDPRVKSHLSAFKDFNKARKIIAANSPLQTSLEDDFNTLFSMIAALPDEKLEQELAELSRDQEMLANDKIMLIDFLQRILAKNPQRLPASALLAQLTPTTQEAAIVHLSDESALQVPMDVVLTAESLPVAAPHTDEPQAEAMELPDQTFFKANQEQEKTEPNLLDVSDNAQQDTVPENSTDSAKNTPLSSQPLSQDALDLTPPPENTAQNVEEPLDASDATQDTVPENSTDSAKNTPLSSQPLSQDALDLTPPLENSAQNVEDPKDSKTHKEWLYASSSDGLSDSSRECEKPKVTIVQREPAIASDRIMAVNERKAREATAIDSDVAESLLQPTLLKAVELQGDNHDSNTSIPVVSPSENGTASQAIEHTLSRALSVLDNLKEIRSTSNAVLTNSEEPVFRGILSLRPLPFGQNTASIVLPQIMTTEPAQQVINRTHPLSDVIPAAKYLGIKQLVVYDKRFVNERSHFEYTDVPLKQISVTEPTSKIRTFNKSLQRGCVQLDYDFVTAESCPADLSRYARTSFIIAARKEQSFIPKENADGRVVLFLVEEEREFAAKAVQTGIDAIIVKSFTLGKAITAENLKLPFARRIALFLIARELGLSNCMVLDDNILSYHLKKNDREAFQFQDVFNEAAQFSKAQNTAVVCIKSRRYSQKRADSDFAAERIAPKSFYYDLQAIAGVFKSYDDYQMLLPPNDQFRLYGEDFYFAALFFHLGLLIMTLPEDAIVLSRSKLGKNKCVQAFTGEDIPMWTKIANPQHFNEIAKRAYADLCYSEQRGITYHNMRNARIRSSSFFGSAFKPQKSTQLPMPSMQEIRMALSDDVELNPLRPHQQDAVKSFLEKGTLTSLFQLPTGTGKTLLFLKLIQLLRTHIKFFRQKNFAIIAFDLAMAEQIKRAMETYNDILSAHNKNPAFNIELDVCVVGTGKDVCQETFAAMRDVVENGRLKIIIFCQRSFQHFVLSDRPEDEARNKRHQEMFNAVFIDEIHQTSPKILALCAKDNPDRPDWFVAGFDATPGKKGAKYFDSVHHLSIQQARQASLIAPHIFKPYHDVENFKQKLYEVITQSCDPRGNSLEHCKGIIYTANIPEANAVCADLKRKGLRVACFHSQIKLKEREKLLEEYQQKKINCLVAVSMLGVGFDGDVDYEIFLKSGEEDKTIQQIGRALRIRREDPTKIALIIGPQDLIKDPKLRNTLEGYPDSQNYRLSANFRADSNFSEVVLSRKRKEPSSFEASTALFFNKRPHVSTPQGAVYFQPILRA